MEQSQACCGSVCYDRLPPLSANYPWLVSQNLECDDQVFYTIYDTCHYRCRIPELLGKRIEAYYRGWVILSDHPHNVMWSLWNPLTSKIIRLPPLSLKDGDPKSITECCLTSLPDEPSSILLLMSTQKAIFVFCRLDQKKKRLRWTEMSYSKQLKRITSDGDILYSMTCGYGKVYALSKVRNFDAFIIQVDIVVKDSEVLITLLPFWGCPVPSYNSCSSFFHFLKGSRMELFYIRVGFHEETKKTLGAVCLFRLRKGGMKWEELEDLKDAIFFVDLARDFSVSYSPVNSPGLGGYVHIFNGVNNIMYAYQVKDNTISVSLVPSLVLPTSYVSVWECRLEGDTGEAKCTLHFKQEEAQQDKIVVRSCVDDEVEFTGTMNESHRPYLPFDILEMIMEFCVGVEYMYFRATCKRFHLAAPFIQWSNEVALKRLQKYFVVSPWLMVVEKNQDIITFIDPILGDRYYMKNLYASIMDGRICYSGFGWVLFYSSKPRCCLMFFNPFTKEIRELPHTFHDLGSLYFSAPPTSHDCMVVGFTTEDDECLVYIHFVAREATWRVIRMDFGGANPSSLCFPTFHDHGIYTLCNEGELYFCKDLERGNSSWKLVEAKVPSSCGNSPSLFLVKCNEHLLLVTVGEFGKSVEVFKLNDSAKGWEKMQGLGRYMIYISDSTCLCIEAKIHEMENKIFFSRMHSKKRNIVFYSLDTCMYHTFNRKNIEEPFENFFGTTRHLSPYAWIEPCWS